MPQKLTKLELGCLIILVIAAILSFAPLNITATSDGLLHVYFLDVGQGDAEFIQSQSGRQVLIDGGPDGTILQRLGEVMPLGDRSIDLLILSHAHADHVAGLVEVLKRYDVGTIIENSLPYDSGVYQEWNNLKKEARVVQAHAGQEVDLGNDVRLTILFPYQSGTASTKIKNAHDFMVVTRLDYGKESVLFTGDMEDELEERLVSYGSNLEADFLKIGHHGSKTSTSTTFLNAVQPKIAFMGLGKKNRYGHPYPTTLARLENYGIPYYRTDEDGSSELQLDGHRYKVKNF